MDKHYLNPLFRPARVVVFAGDEEAGTRTPAGRDLVAALGAQPFDGSLRFLDDRLTGTLAELADARVDLAVIALPVAEALRALELAGRIKCKAAIVLGGGVAAEVARDMQRIARQHGVQLLGPNSLGLQRPRAGLNAGLAGPLAAPGSLALVSQSGALTTAILDWAARNEVGFSAVASIGPHAAVDLAQVLDYLAVDADTQGIVVYMEGITHARRFMSSLRAAANAKPVVVLKAGRKQAGNVAARTHSGAIVGRDAVFDAALRRAGAVRVRTFSQLFSAAKCLASRYRPVGRRLAVITNGGGPGVLAADWISEIGLELGLLSDAAVSAVQSQLPAAASLTDLIDLSEEAGAEHYRHALEAARNERAIDGVLVVHAPKSGIDAAAVAAVLAAAAPRYGKPLLACWMGEGAVAGGRELLAQAALPDFRTPEAAVGAFGNIASFYQNQQLLQQMPPPLSDLPKPDLEGARLIIENALAERRQVLTEVESKALLSAFHIPVTQTLLARDANEAMMIATQLGFPVVLKIDSPDISHKSDVDGVALDVMNATAVRDLHQTLLQAVARQQPSARVNGVTIQKMVRSRRGRELYIGLKTDDPFGPVIAFGAGGRMVELFGERSMELPPLNQFLARRMIERARVAETLGPWRGAEGVDKAALEHVLLRVSEMACELPQLREMDINPIIADAGGAIAVDARIVVEATPASVRRHSQLAILPYPAHHEQTWPMPGGGEYTIRAIQPDDAEMLQELVRGLSPQSRYFRFVSSLLELPASMLARFTLIDYDREMALVAVQQERRVADDGSSAVSERIIGVSRYITNPDRSSGEFSLVVADDFSGKGLGSRLMQSLIEEARDKGLAELDGLVLSGNTSMLRLMQRLGFEIRACPDDADFRICTLALQ